MKLKTKKHSWCFLPTSLFISLLSLGIMTSNVCAQEVWNQEKIDNYFELRASEFGTGIETNEDIDEIRQEIEEKIDKGEIKLSNDDDVTYLSTDGNFTKFIPDRQLRERPPRTTSESQPARRNARGRNTKPENGGFNFKGVEDSVGVVNDLLDKEADGASGDVKKLAFILEHRNILAKLRRGTIVDERDLEGQTEEEKELRGEGLLKSGLSRNHRLADSSLKSILVWTGYTLSQETDRDSEKYKNIQESFRTLGYTLGGLEGLKATQEWLENIEEQAKKAKSPTFGLYQNVLKKISGTKYNTRIGDAERNRKIDNAFDPNLDSQNRWTLKSKTLQVLVKDLERAGAIPERLVEATTTPAKVPGTDKEASSSSTPKDKERPVVEVPLNIEELEKQIKEDRRRSLNRAREQQQQQQQQDEARTQRKKRPSNAGHGDGIRKPRTGSSGGKKGR